ncbi:MAG: ribose-phosphate pyrophosphokinase [Magnetococcales bacterium]|nr:ribose-phosphate pyrophosphokinase [Magnetococcales bacterium]
MQRIKIFSGTSNPLLAERIASYLSTSLGSVTVKRFSDGEIFVQVDENVRGRDVFIVQSTSAPANDHLMELMVMVDALRRASAGRITAVVPYFGYARQDRKEMSRTAISAKLVADLLEVTRVGRVLTMDLHSGQIQGFFNIPVDNIYATPVLLEAIRSKKLENGVVVSPDVGGVVRARSYAKRLNMDLAIIDKRRPAANVAEVHHIIGDVKGKECLIVDDMVDTAGTLCKAADKLVEQGAKSVLAACSHPVLSGPAIKRIEESALSGLLVSDTIQLTKHAAACSKVEVHSVSNLLGEAIRRIADEESLSTLFV